MARVRKTHPSRRILANNISKRRIIGDSSIYGETSFPYGASTTEENSVLTEYDRSVSLFQKDISASELRETAERNPLASVIIMDVASDVFQKGFTIKKIAEDEETGEHEAKEDKSFNTKFQILYKNILKSELLKAYQQARLHGCSLLLLGYNDGENLSVAPDPESKINYVFSVPKIWVEEIAYKTNADGEIYLPLQISYYKLKQGSMDSKVIHPKRVIHIENPGISSDLTGTSALLPCYDDLLVLKHVTWGAGQTMWRSGNQLIVVIAPPRASEAQITAIDDALVDLNAQSAFTLPYGSTVNAYAPSGLNPEPYATIPLNNIAAATRIPLSILIGAQAGALSASLTDQRDYANTLAGIQENVITPILTKIFKRFQFTGQLPWAEFDIEWKSTLTMSLQEQTLVEYRQALTARINQQVETDSDQALAERNENGTAGPYPQIPEATWSQIAGSNTSSEESGSTLEQNETVAVV